MLYLSTIEELVTEEKDFKLNIGILEFETEDQIAAAIHMGKLNYIDKERIGIFGWSYGGYMSSLCISKGADVFILQLQ